MSNLEYDVRKLINVLELNLYKMLLNIIFNETQFSIFKIYMST